MTIIDPEQERLRLEGVYAGMSDGELDKLLAEADELTDVARAALKAEMERRGAQVEYTQEPAVQEPEHPRLVTVARFRDLAEATVAKGMLESAGVECFLADENLIRMDWFYSNAIGGMRLQVRQDDAELATEIMKQKVPDDFPLNDDGERYQQPTCPKCQSLDIHFEGVDRQMAFTTMWIGVPLPFRRDAWKCSSCGHEWPEEEVKA
jgi:Putative prokaryotic signal transducing protein